MDFDVNKALIFVCINKALGLHVCIHAINNQIVDTSHTYNLYALGSKCLLIPPHDIIKFNILQIKHEYLYASINHWGCVLYTCNY